MPRAYSQDLRERVVAFVDCGHSRRAAAAHFDVSPSFVINLMTAYRARGSLAPKRLGGRRHAKLDPHRVFLLRRVAEKDDITMPELAGELEAECGTRADPASISRWLIRNGYRFKKNASGQRMRSPRYPPGARGMAHGAAPRDAARAAKAGLPRRDRNHDENDAPARTLPEGQAPPVQSPFRPLEDPDLCRRIALRRPHRALRHRCADGPQNLRNRCRDPTRPNPRKRRHRHHGQSARPQKPNRREGHPRPGRTGSVPAALQPRSQPDRDGLLKTQGSSARQGCPNHRRTLESHRSNLRPVPTRRVQKLLHRRRIRIHVTLRRSKTAVRRVRSFVVCNPPSSGNISRLKKLSTRRRSSLWAVQSMRFQLTNFRAVRAAPSRSTRSCASRISRPTSGRATS